MKKFVIILFKIILFPYFIPQYFILKRGNRIHTIEYINSSVISIDGENMGFDSSAIAFIEEYKLKNFSAKRQKRWESIKLQEYSFGSLLWYKNIFTGKSVRLCKKALKRVFGYVPKIIYFN